MRQQLNRDNVQGRKKGLKRNNGTLSAGKWKNYKGKQHHNGKNEGNINKEVKWDGPGNGEH